MKMKNKFATFFKPVRYWIDKHVYKLKRYASMCGIQTSKLNFHKIARQPYDI